MKDFFNRYKESEENLKSKEKLLFSIFMIAMLFLGLTVVFPQLANSLKNMSFPSVNPTDSFNKFIDNSPERSSIITDREIIESDYINLAQKLNDCGLADLLDENGYIVANFFELTDLQLSQDLSLTTHELGALINLVIASTTQLNFSFLEITMASEQNTKLLAVSDLDITNFLLEAGATTENKNIYLLNDFEVALQDNELYLNPIISSINGYFKEHTQLLEDMLNLYLLETGYEFGVLDMNAYLICKVVNLLLYSTQTTLNINENVINFLL